jgi:hypothetical protein
MERFFVEHCSVEMQSDDFFFHEMMIRRYSVVVVPKRKVLFDIEFLRGS